jgi:DNA-binding sugar fermentation-stimulating protein
MEIKSVMLVQGGRALFPDAITARGARHIDPEFADVLACASESGVRLLGYRCEVTVEEARHKEPIPVILDRGSL